MRSDGRRVSRQPMEVRSVVVRRTPSRTVAAGNKYSGRADPSDPAPKPSGDRCSDLERPHFGGVLSPADDRGERNRVRTWLRSVAADRRAGSGRRRGGRCCRVWHRAVARDDGLRVADPRARHAGAGEIVRRRPALVESALRVDGRVDSSGSARVDNPRSHDRQDPGTVRANRHGTCRARIGDRRGRRRGPRAVGDRLAALRDGGPVAPALVAAGGAPCGTRPAGTATPYAMHCQGSVSTGRPNASHHGVWRGRIGQDPR